MTRKKRAMKAVTYDVERLLETCSPLGDRVLLRLLDKSFFVNETPGGIIIPEASQEVHQRNCQGEIVAVGGRVREPTLLPGLRVVAKFYNRSWIGDSGNYWFAREGDIVALLTEDDADAERCTTCGSPPNGYCEKEVDPL